MSKLVPSLLPASSLITLATSFVSLTSLLLPAMNEKVPPVVGFCTNVCACSTDSRPGFARKGRRARGYSRTTRLCNWILGNHLVDCPAPLSSASATSLNTTTTASYSSSAGPRATAPVAIPRLAGWRRRRRGRA
ncbi:hypothetical protein C8R47DRAFT_1105377 [Mycena vitilis]|nr:hypothetical protein C8R47DRAFT_1105377 [Mycena vitilis]